MAYKQFGYHQGGLLDKSYSIVERNHRYYVTLDLIPRYNRRTTGTPSRTVTADFPLLSEAQTFIGKKAY